MLISAYLPQCFKTTGVAAKGKFLQSLTWSRTRKSFLVLKKPQSRQATAALQGLMPVLVNLGVTAYLEPALWDELNTIGHRFDSNCRRYSRRDMDGNENEV